MKPLLKPPWVIIGIFGFAVWFLWLSEPLAYTESQSEQGREVYRVNCLSCHGEAGLGGAGPPLNNILQKFPTEQDVFDYASTFMPVGRAGELPKEEYEAVTAYIMSLNGVEAKQVQPKQEDEPNKEAQEPESSEEPTDSKDTAESKEPKDTQEEISEVKEDNPSTTDETSEEQMNDQSEVTSEETIADPVTGHNSETTNIEVSEAKKEASKENKLWLVILLIVIVGCSVWLIRKKRKKLP
jgi:mono/diheme cytochrome c family protein